MEKAASTLFKALSDETRLRLFNLFIRSKKALCVCELVDALKQPQYTVSKHLTVLKSAGLLKAERHGKWMYYSLNEEVTINKQLFTFLRDFLNDETFHRDCQYLQLRLNLREDDKCVTGLVPLENLDAASQQLQKPVKNNSAI